MQTQSLEHSNRIYRFGYVVLLVYIVATALLQKLPFSGDQVALISHPANILYESGFKTLITPADYDTGHPPIIPALFAGIWMIFGRTLFISHLFMLLTVILLYNTFIKFCSRFLSTDLLFIPTILFLCFPLISVQNMSMGADIFIALFFFWALNAAFDKKEPLFIISCALLLLASLRGIPCIIILILIRIYGGENLKKKNRNFIILSVLLASVPFILWNIFHYSKTGWLITHNSSPWIDQRQPVNFISALSNFFIFFFRFTEAGFFSILIIIILGLRKLKLSCPLVLWRCLFICCGVLFIFFIPFRNPILNRYFLIPQMILLLIASVYLAAYRNIPLRNIILSAVCVLFIASNFIVYPEKMNKAIGYNWDATFAFLPYPQHFREETYRSIQSETSAYMDKTFVVGTGFPVYQSYYDTDLRTDMENSIYQPIKFIQFDTADLQKFDFVIYSNMMNEIPLSIRNTLRNEWITIYDRKIRNLHFEVYKNKRLQ